MLTKVPDRRKKAQYNDEPNFWDYLSPMYPGKYGSTQFFTFPQGFRIFKNIGHPTLGSWGKKTVKRYLKSEQTDRQTDRQTNKHTYGHFDL